LPLKKSRLKKGGFFILHTQQAGKLLRFSWVVISF